MQKEDGSFYSKFYPHHGGKNDQWTSLYYPGEAALGLLMLYEKDPDPLWLQTAANAIAYLARLRAGRPSAPATVIVTRSRSSGEAESVRS